MYFLGMQLTNGGLLTIVTWHGCLEAMIVSKHHMLRKYLKQFCSIKAYLFNTSYNVQTSLRLAGDDFAQKVPFWFSGKLVKFL